MRRISRILTLAVTLVLVATPVWAAVAPGGSFLDDDGDQHEAAIESIATERITRGCNPPTNDRFCPDQAVTRAEMATFLARGLTLPAGNHPFADVSDANVHRHDIAALATADITRGCNPPTNTNFCPDRAVTRAEMATFLARALTLPAGNHPFADVSDANVHRHDIAALATADITRGCNPPTNTNFCPDRAVTRAEMATFLARALALPQLTVPERTVLRAAPVGAISPVSATERDGVTWIGSLPGDSRLFAAAKRGVVESVGPGSQRVLDITELVSDRPGERGLLGMAVHPSGDGRLVVHYTDTAGDSRIVEYHWDGIRIDPDSARLLLRIPQPTAIHNGGGLAFDDEGLLYIASGDGGTAGDSADHAQDTRSLLGSVLRIDPVGDTFTSDSDRNYTIPSSNPFANGIGGDPAVWLWGVRNPWRIHHYDGHLYVADVGQDTREEVTVVAVSSAGGNLGWNRLEGSTCFIPGCSPADTILPIHEYAHPQGCSITGGVVFPKGPADIAGRYVFGDFCSSWLATGDLSGSHARQIITRPDSGLRQVITFGVDAEGNVYAGARRGQIWRIDAG